MPAESRTEFIQFCDKKRICDACGTNRCVKNLRFKDFSHFSFSAGILMPEDSRTEFIQSCDKSRIVTPAAQFCYAKIFDLWIFAFLLFYTYELLCREVAMRISLRRFLICHISRFAFVAHQHYFSYFISSVSHGG